LYRFRLSNLGFNDGTSYSPAEITVFVGPNNAGKSRILKDILAQITQPAAPHVIVQTVQTTVPTNFAELREAYDVKVHQDPSGAFGFSTLHSTLWTGHSFWNWTRSVMG
jgi:ABC-type cobalamin/Fe3+-siderophores transport system ATPase subunit